jgi:hypothetical protein
MRDDIVYVTAVFFYDNKQTAAAGKCIKWQYENQNNNETTVVYVLDATCVHVRRASVVVSLLNVSFSSSAVAFPHKVLYGSNVYLDISLFNGAFRSTIL